MVSRPEDLEERARQAAHQLRQATALDPPHFHDALNLARAGKVVSTVFGVAVLAFLAGVVFAAGSIVGPAAFVWLAAGILIALVVATSAVAAHAGGHALLVSLPGAALAVAWFVSISGGHREASAWWFLAGSCAFSAMAVMLAAWILRARAITRSVPTLSLVGATGVAVSALDPVGVARVQGETWTAESISGSLAPGAPVHVVRIQGLRVLVWSETGDVVGADGLTGRVES